MTIDGFALTGDPKKGFPSLTARLAVTTYLTPPGEGLANGATPAAPAPVASASDPVPATRQTASPSP
jgi:hypothetical protein